MKIKSLLLFFCLCVFSHTYSQKVLSLYSLFTEQDAVLIPGIEGTWFVEDFNMLVSISKAGDNFYFLKYGDSTNASVSEAAFTRIKNELFLDLNGIIPDTLWDRDYRNSFIKSHSFYKVQLKGDSMRLAEANYTWFYNYAIKKQLPLKHEWANNAMLLTLKTDEMQAFLGEHLAEKEVFDDIGLLLKKLPHSTKQITANEESDVTTVTTSQNCTPSFPFLDGWLGGDGDVSVRLNKNTSLFLFSDTYVGNNEHQNQRGPGMKMVSSTVAVQTCLPNGETDIKYFWNNMYTEHPEPIFKSFTSRYIYWVNEAFMAHGNLYVVLEKVGAKQAVAPDELFGFSLLGFTLAKITNPHQPPTQWNIELIPLRDFVHPYMSIRAHAIKDNYVYFFVSRNDNAQLLVRKKTALIHDPEKPFEYYALNKTWKEGINREDMDTLIHGFRGTTVNYHPDIKKWIRVTDIKFMDNKINIRTAPALEGPWSDEITVYEVPEATAGTTLYHKTNFCYLPRECMQYYDYKKHKMLITYDTNNSNSSVINANPRVYTPKVITVSLIRKSKSR